jgi:hypothetical protein
MCAYSWHPHSMNGFDWRASIDVGLTTFIERTLTRVGRSVGSVNRFELSMRVSELDVPPFGDLDHWPCASLRRGDERLIDLSCLDEVQDRSNCA